MKTTKFLIQFEYDEQRTRWITNDEDFRDILTFLAHRGADQVTVGQCPAVTVTQEECSLNWEHVTNATA